MKNTSPKVDAYIDRTAVVAKPILTKIRRLFHLACPEIEETIKWGMPHFEYKGLVGAMAAFKAHVGLWFWKGKLMKDPRGLFADSRNAGMATIRITDPSELPDDKILIAYVKEAIQLNEAAVKVPRKPGAAKKKKLTVPDYFMAALKKNKLALKTFEEFSYSNQRDYVEWVTEAKQEATRQRRLATAIEWMAAGRPRNWKYLKKRG